MGGDVFGDGPRVRAAGPEDAAEIVRLRRLMFAAFGTDTASDPGWEARAEEVLRRELGRLEDDAQMRCFVVDAPAGGWPPALSPSSTTPCRRRATTDGWGTCRT
ncbi:MAG: hypothetical protein ACTHQ3_21105 [Motilibacteraceae bacterium]